MSTGVTRIRFVEAIAEALRLEFGRDSQAIYLGTPQDDPFAEELGAVAGSDRVVEVQPGERTVIARAVGAALEGYHPVCRLSAAELPGRGLDQLVEAQGLQAVEGLRTPVTVLVDRPAADHGPPGDADAPERWLVPAAVPTVSPSSPAEAKGLVAAAVRAPTPVCVIVDERLAAGNDHVPEGGHLIRIGRAHSLRRGSALTVVGHGASVGPAFRLASELDLDIDLVDLRSIVPLDHSAVIESVKRTSRLVVFEPTFVPSPVGDAVVAAVVAAAFEYLDAPPLQIAMGSHSDTVLREALGELLGY